LDGTYASAAGLRIERVANPNDHFGFGGERQNFGVKHFRAAGGKGVLILSKIRVVHDSDCLALGGANCINKGYAVVTQRFVIGTKTLRPSSFGTPTAIDSTGNVHNWATDPSARAEDFPANLKSGEFTYAAECYLTSQESRGGVYSRAMF